MTNEEAAKILEYPVLKWSMDWDDRDDGLSYCEAIEKAIKALRASHLPDTTKMDPLTLNQLREMLENDGEIIGAAVIVSEDGVLSHAVLDARVEDGICASTGASGEWMKEKDYGKTWIAYAYQSSCIDREAWTAEWKRGKYPSGTHYLYCSKCGEINGKHSMFCPSCGRAMTPEAWAELEKRLRGW